MADTTELHIALREAHQIGASDSFFAARKELRDTEHERYIFDAGFRRGFDAHESTQRKANVTNSSDAAHPDDVAIDHFAAAMKAKMAASRAKGRGGWENTDICPPGRLQEMLAEHIAKGDPVDVGNFAMMLFNRGEKTTRSQPADAPLSSVDARYRDLLNRLGCNGHDGAIAEINLLRRHLDAPADAALADAVDAIAMGFRQYSSDSADVLNSAAATLRALAVVPDESVESILAAYKSGLSHGAKQTDHEFEFAPGSASDKAYATGYNEGYERRLAMLAAKAKEDGK